MGLLLRKNLFDNLSENLKNGEIVFLGFGLLSIETLAGFLATFPPSIIRTKVRRKSVNGPLWRVGDDEASKGIQEFPKLFHHDTNNRKRANIELEGLGQLRESGRNLLIVVAGGLFDIGIKTMRLIVDSLSQWPSSFLGSPWQTTNLP